MPILKADGRGRSYSPARGLVEALLGLTYSGDWPGRVSGRLPGAGRVVLRRFQLPLERRGRPPLRLGFASDLHFGPTTPPSALERSAALLAGESLDLLVLGGDYVFLEATEARARALEAWVRAVPARAAVAVLGNHDLWTHHQRLERALERAGVEVLVNRSLALPPPHDDIRVAGLDEPWTGAPDADAALSGPPRPITLAVAHSPDGLPFFVDRGVDLLLCGHTHGGQLALPGHRYVVMPSQIGRRMPYGLRRERGIPVYTSRGVGNVEVALRTFAPPDVAVFEIGGAPQR